VLPLSVPSALLERRPDIAAAERRVAEANARVGVATAAFFPNLLLAATGGLEATRFSSWLEAPSRFWSLGPQLAFTVLDFGGRAAARDAARAAYDENVADYRQTVLIAFRQVEDNLNALEVLRRESEAQRDAVDAAQRALGKVSNRYENGAITYLSVVVTQAIVLSDQRTAVGIERRRMAASVALVKALGGGWTTVELPSAEAVSRRD
jgi:NodT family efflux transporter outer membrane factor (OMF) lipoprotein